MRDASDDPDEQQHCDALGSSTVIHAGGMIQESVRRGTRPRELAWGITVISGTWEIPLWYKLCVPSGTAVGLVLRLFPLQVGPVKHVRI
eukprot:SAG11_NODE_14450_length_611_cov_1.591797_1_plen_89_part_00